MATSSNTPKGYATRAPCRNPPLKADSVILQQTLSAEELRDWINERVAARYQCVDRVEIMPDFPRNVAGKTLKRDMREPYWEGRGRKI